MLFHVNALYITVTGVSITNHDVIRVEISSMGFFPGITYISLPNDLQLTYSNESYSSITKIDILIFYEYFVVAGMDTWSKLFTIFSYHSTLR